MPVSLADQMAAKRAAAAAAAKSAASKVKADQQAQIKQNVQNNAIARQQAGRAAASGGSTARPGFFAGTPANMFAPGGYSTPQRANTGGNTGGGNYGRGGYAPQRQGNPTILAKLAADMKRAMDEGKAANETRYADINTGYDARSARALSASDDMIEDYGARSQQYLSAADNTLAGYGNLANTVNAGAAGITSGYAAREKEVGGLLQGLGTQELADVDEAYKGLAAKQQQSLIDRGLGNTSVLDSTERGNEREKQEARNRVNEALRQQQVQVTSELSGDRLAQEGRNLQMTTGLAQDTLSAQERRAALAAQLSQDSISAAERRQALDAQLAREKLQFQEARTDTYPSMTEYANVMTQLGESGYAPASAPVSGGAPPGLSLSQPAGGTYMGFNSGYMPRATNYNDYIASVRRNWKDPHAAQ